MPLIHRFLNAGNSLFSCRESLYFKYQQNPINGPAEIDRTGHLKSSKLIPSGPTLFSSVSFSSAHVPVFSSYKQVEHA